MKIITRLLVVIVGSWVCTAFAQTDLPQLTSKDGCSDGEYVYKAGGKVRVKMHERDPVTHKMVTRDFPEGIRQECVKDEKTGGYRWENIDKMVDGKLVRGPGNESFIASKPIGLAPKITLDEQQLALQQNRVCKDKEGATSIGGVVPSDKGDKFYRCVQIYDENFTVKGAGWVELVFKNGQLVTTPI